MGPWEIKPDIQGTSEGYRYRVAGIWYRRNKRYSVNFDTTEVEEDNFELETELQKEYHRL